MSRINRIGRLLAACTAALTSLAVAGCGTSTAPPTTKASSSASGPLQSGNLGGIGYTVPEEDDPFHGGLPKGAALVSLTADDFYQECKKDPKAAFQRYQKSVIEVTGVVERVFAEEDRQHGTLLLKVKDEFVKGVKCYPVELEPWAKIAPGQQVKIKGVVTELSVNTPALMKCVYVEAGPTTAVTVTSQQLSSEFAANVAAATEKYKDKYVIVTGDVISKIKGVPVVTTGNQPVNNAEFFYWHIELESGPMFRVELVYPPAEARFGTGILEHQTVKVFARVHVGERNVIQLRDGIVFLRP